MAQEIFMGTVGCYVTALAVLVIEFGVGSVLPNVTIVNRLTAGPFFIVPAVCGVLIAVFLSRFLVVGWSMVGTLVLPAAILLNEIRLYAVYGIRDANWLHETLAQFIGPDCGASECLEQVIVTNPFVISLAYVIGRLMATLIRRRKI